MRHTFTREQLKFGHANETRSGHNFVGDWWKHGHKSASSYEHFYIICLKTQKQQLHFVNKKIKIWKINKKINKLKNNSGRALDNRAGRKTVRAGCSVLRNMPSWNTVMTWGQGSRRLIDYITWCLPIIVPLPIIATSRCGCFQLELLSVMSTSYSCYGDSLSVAIKLVLL